MAHRDLLRRQDDADRLYRVLGIFMERTIKYVAILEVDRRNGSLRSPQSEGFLAFPGGRSFSENNVDVGSFAGSRELSSGAAIRGNLKESHTSENAENFSR